VTQHIYGFSEDKSHHKFPCDKLAGKTTSFIDAAIIILERIEMPFQSTGASLVAFRASREGRDIAHSSAQMIDG
jgi:hypothetical protein